MKRKVLLTTLCLILHISVVLAQQVTISGQVLDEKSEPLIGATVNIKGTTNAVITDIDGKFTLKALPSEKIVISYLGYKPMTMTIGKNRKFNSKRLRNSTYETKNKRLVSFGLLISLFPHVWKQFPVFF